MSAVVSTALKGQARHWLSATGLLALARRATGLYVGLRCASRRGFRLVIDGREVRFVTTDACSSRFFHRRYREGQLHEPPVTRDLARRARTARVFADVGAHVGYYSCIAGALNESLRLFLFEMNHLLIPVIERNLRANGRPDAVIVDRPVADRRRVVGYANSSREPGLRMCEATPADGYTLTEAISLDEFFAAAGTAPDLLKIDVEGAELQVLHGAREIIGQHHPIMFVEVHPKVLGGFGGTAQQVYELLRAHGYRIRRYLGHRGDDTDLEPVDASAILPDRTHMLLCV